LNAIITKTALFINHHGTQLEILIKTKQAKNPQFAFLSIDEPLHRYYKYMYDAIKSGKYNPEKQPEKEETGKHIILYIKKKEKRSHSNYIEVDIIELK
jgi:hypothetical protein